MPGERVLRNIDPIEVAVIGRTVLHMIDDLQRRAQGVVRRPRGAALAMHIEHEAPDRHRRVAAIVDQVVPVAVAQLGRVHAERGKQVLGVARRKAVRRQRVAQPCGDRLALRLAGEAVLQPIDERELLGRRQRRMIGDVVGDADEFVERQDGRAMARMNEPRGDREILVVMALAGTQIGSRRHRNLDVLACTRPFHSPPRPRAC